MEKATFALEKATLAGGCFWCLDQAFAGIPGIVETEVGYAGGNEIDPTYEAVSSGSTGHREAIQLVFDAAIITYDEILVHFWSHIDPTDSGGQFADRGFSYTTAIWYRNDTQKRQAIESMERLRTSGLFEMPIVTQILPFTTFYPAEDYHQKYFLKSSFRYGLYKQGSGRENFLEKNWTPEAIEYLRGKDAFLAKKYRKPADQELHASLSDIAYDVTQKGETEVQYTSDYATSWNDGIYVDIASGEPLFSSRDQYDAGCGWPSFTKPIDTHFLTEHHDVKYGMVRTEVRSKYGDSHLGHLFDDGPKAKGGARYCINGAALRFIPKEELEKEGYGEFVELFAY